MSYESELQQNSFNVALMMVWPLRKVVPKQEVPLSIASVACTCFMTLSWII